MLLKAIEEKRFHPVGSDLEVASDFQLIAGTNTDLKAAVRDGRFREDLLARIQLWTFRLPPLRDRIEDVEPNLDYELELLTRSSGHRVLFSREARRWFLDFAESSDAVWAGNFRDLNAAVCRMATLAGCAGGRITTAIVEAEIGRLREQWRLSGSGDAQTLEQNVSTDAGSGVGGDEVLSGELRGDLDLFDRIQLKGVLEVCRESRSMSDAGRRLFEVSRGRKVKANDADRLRKYLLRFGLDWNSVKSE
jgi:transcriptional regulatory protein RtcR